MSYRGGGVLAPIFVKSCSIRNDSIGDVQILVTYSKLEHEAEDSNDHLSEMYLAQGQTQQVAPRVVSDGGCQYNSHIHRIDVTLSSGRKLFLEEPFDGVKVIEIDWVFAINDHGIKSLPPGN
jgi:hypothetical protein